MQQQLHAGSGIDPDTGKHTDNWIEEHRRRIHRDVSLGPRLSVKNVTEVTLSCREGISDVSCFNGNCHNSSNGAPIGHPRYRCMEEAGTLTEHAQRWLRAMRAVSQSARFAMAPRTPHFLEEGSLVRPVSLAAMDRRRLLILMTGCRMMRHTHTTTDPGNAPVCANCHFHRNKLPADAAADLPPFVPAPDGTPPGCFNSTLCHGADEPASSRTGAPRQSTVQWRRKRREAPAVSLIVRYVMGRFHAVRRGVALSRLPRCSRAPSVRLAAWRYLYPHDNRCRECAGLCQLPQKYQSGDAGLL